MNERTFHPLSPRLLLAATVLALAAAACDPPTQHSATEAPPADVATLAPDVQEVPAPAEPCECPLTQHCDAATGECVWNVCTPGQATCDSTSTRLLCNGDGSASVLEACPSDRVCYLGECAPVVCDNTTPPACDGGEVSVCNSVGTGFSRIPCPGGTECALGACRPIQANVLLVVDTSDSMNSLWDTAMHADDCEGWDCPPWQFPSCDDPSEPQTRLGRAKLALQEILTGEHAAEHRIALQRFPQGPLLYGAPACRAGWYSPELTLSDDPGTHTTGAAWFADRMWEVIAEPFPDSRTTDTEALLSWVDFSEALTPVGPSCDVPMDCKTGTCLAGECQGHSDPELRAVGGTPLGRSLFYAGEYLRHFVLVEGRPCAGDVDCASPHHTCQAGRCRDPWASCRPNVVILLTDGGESVAKSPGDFFHPHVQAKRMHFGLGCETPADCVADATCEYGTCRAPGPSIGSPVGGYVDSEGADRLTDAEGTPVSVTVHVVDASGNGGQATNELIALWGGGQHVPVDFDDLDSLVQGFIPLLDVKSGLAKCE